MVQSRNHVHYTKYLDIIYCIYISNNHIIGCCAQTFFYLMNRKDFEQIMNYCILYLEVESNQKIDIDFSNNHSIRYHDHFLLDKQKILKGIHLCLIPFGQIME